MWTLLRTSNFGSLHPYGVTVVQVLNWNEGISTQRVLGLTRWSASLRKSVGESTVMSRCRWWGSSIRTWSRVGFWRITYFFKLACRPFDCFSQGFAQIYQPDGRMNEMLKASSSQAWKFAAFTWGVKVPSIPVLCVDWYLINYITALGLWWTWCWCNRIHSKDSSFRLSYWPIILALDFAIAYPLVAHSRFNMKRHRLKKLSGRNVLVLILVTTSCVVFPSSSE